MPEIRFCDASDLTEEERWCLASEVEARNTARRMNMTAEGAAATLRLGKLRTLNPNARSFLENDIARPDREQRGRLGRPSFNSTRPNFGDFGGCYLNAGRSA